MFVILPNILMWQGSSFDISGSFRELTGMEIEDYIRLGFALLTRYDSINVAQIENADISIPKGDVLR